MTLADRRTEGAHRSTGACACLTAVHIEMWVRQVRENECHRGCYELPIRMPATNTSVPPSIIWNAADRNGVSIQR